MASMGDLRIGVIGMGARGSLAVEAHQPGAGAAVVAVADVAGSRRERARSLFGPDVETVADYHELLDAGLDAAFILTPDHLHEEQAATLLAAGIPTYVEKPLAITITGCDRILAAAMEHGTRLYVGHNMRHSPVVLKMRELIASGAIGEVKAVWCRHFVGHGGEFYFKDWHADRSKSTGLLLQKGAHDIDVIHWLAGGYTRRVTAMGGLTLYGQITDRRDNSGRLMSDWLSDTWPPLSLRGLNPVVDVEDLSMVTMALDNGVFATYEQCHFTPDYWRNYTIIGTEGRIENFGDADDSEIRLWNRRCRYNSRGDAAFPVRAAGSGHDGADVATVAEFLRFVRDGGSTNTSPLAAREAVVTGVTATESLRAGGSVLPVPAPDESLVKHFADN